MPGNARFVLGLALLAAPAALLAGGIEKVVGEAVGGLASDSCEERIAASQRIAAILRALETGRKDAELARVIRTLRVLAASEDPEVRLGISGLLEPYKAGGVRWEARFGDLPGAVLFGEILPQGVLAGGYRLEPAEAPGAVAMRGWVRFYSFQNDMVWEITDLPSPVARATLDAGKGTVLVFFGETEFFLQAFQAIRAIGLYTTKGSCLWFRDVGGGAGPDRQSWGERERFARCIGTSGGDLLAGGCDSGQGWIEALDAEKGTVRWQKGAADLPGKVGGLARTGRHVVAGGSFGDPVMFGAADSRGWLEAYDPATGRPAWRKTDDLPGGVSGLLSCPAGIIASGNDAAGVAWLALIDPETGKTAWARKAVDLVGITLCVDARADRLLVGGDSGVSGSWAGLCDARTGKLLRERKGPGNLPGGLHELRLASHGAMARGVTLEGIAWAAMLDPETGNVLWERGPDLFPGHLGVLEAGPEGILAGGGGNPEAGPGVEGPSGWLRLYRVKDADAQ